MEQIKFNTKILDSFVKRLQERVRNGNIFFMHSKNEVIKSSSAKFSSAYNALGMVLQFGSDFKIFLDKSQHSTLHFEKGRVERVLAELKAVKDSMVGFANELLQDVEARREGGLVSEFIRDINRLRNVLRKLYALHVTYEKGPYDTGMSYSEFQKQLSALNFYTKLRMGENNIGSYWLKENRNQLYEGYERVYFSGVNDDVRPFIMFMNTVQCDSILRKEDIDTLLGLFDTSGVYFDKNSLEFVLKQIQERLTMLGQYMRGHYCAELPAMNLEVRKVIAARAKAVRYAGEQFIMKKMTQIFAEDHCVNAVSEVLDDLTEKTKNSVSKRDRLIHRLNRERCVSAIKYATLLRVIDKLTA